MHSKSKVTSMYQINETMLENLYGFQEKALISSIYGKKKKLMRIFIYASKSQPIRSVYSQIFGTKYAQNQANNLELLLSYVKKIKLTGLRNYWNRALHHLLKSWKTTWPSMEIWTLFRLSIRKSREISPFLIQSFGIKDQSIYPLTP